jgi:beta-N-acetylhexosaminidase
LNAGIDLLLVSYDGRQYYPMMDCLLAAAARGDLDSALLEASARRLDRLSAQGGLRRKTT